MGSISFRSLLLFSAIFRVGLIVYGEWQDTHMKVRYTDVDYLVFSDAASLVAAGESPYKRTTYRYSPLLAFMLLPNSLLHRAWGKLVFSAADLLVGLFIRDILKQRKVPETLCNYSVMAWLANPFTFTIGTRGNCEPVVCAILLWIILCLMNGKLLQSAFWYGLVVHFRIYPIIYALPIALVFHPHACRSGQRSHCSNWTPDEGKKPKSSLTCLYGTIPAWKSIFTRGRILFGLVSGAVFFFFTGLFYFLYGWEFLNEALLYHLTRTDPRHNFSIYFYHIYLHSEQDFSTMEKLFSFLPQLAVQLVLVLHFAQDLPFCMFLQTVAFVAFNKVMTAQYFVWFFCLLPLLLPWSTIKMKWRGSIWMLLWMGAQGHWLLWGYLLEFKGKNVFLELWVASLVFFACNSLMIIVFIGSHRFSPLFLQLEPGNSKDTVKRN